MAGLRRVIRVARVARSENLMVEIDISLMKGPSLLCDRVLGKLHVGELGSRAKSNVTSHSRAASLTV